MQLLVLILNKEEYLDEILEAFMEIGITGATVIDSMGMGRVLAYEIPIFAGLRRMIHGSKAYNMTVFAVVRDEAKLHKAISTVEEICGDLSLPGKGLLFIIDLDRVEGLAPES